MTLIVIAVIFTVLWGAVTGSVSLLNLAFGFMLSILALYLVREDLKPQDIRIRPLKLLRLVLLFFKELALSLGVRQVTAIPMSALKGENVVYSGKSVIPWYEGPTLVETLELATLRSGQSTGFRLPVQRVSRPGESFRGYQGTVAGGAVKPGDSVAILPSGQVANVKQIVLRPGA